VSRLCHRVDGVELLVVLVTLLSLLLPMLLLCREVGLTNAHMVGTVPSTVSALSRLTFLDIRNSPGLTGRIPDTITGLTALQFVHVDVLSQLLVVGCDLTLAWCRRALVLSGCGFAGGIPTGIGSLVKLTYVAAATCFHVSVAPMLSLSPCCAPRTALFRSQAPSSRAT
jgi:hypothetical protein